MGTATSKKNFRDKGISSNHSIAPASSNGLSIAPPTYGIESVDHPSTKFTPEQKQTFGMLVQRKANLSAESGDTGAKNRTGLPKGLKSGVESISDLSLDDVRVHYNSPKPAELQALAYTQGTDIHVAPGQERHLPHEAWHVVQQKQGRVKPTMQMKSGVAVNDDTGLEQEADRMGAKAAARQPAFQFKKDAAHTHDCGCSTCHSVQPLQRKVVQMKRVTDGTMAAVAENVQGSSTQSTTAVTKESNGKYKVYAQQKTAEMDDRIEQYDNLSTGATDGAAYGFHAEVLALSEDLSWTKIAASQPICMRCQAILKEQGKTGVNKGDHYTGYWRAPGDYDIDGGSTYPAAADHGIGGDHGTRWTRKDDQEIKYENGDWQKIHKAPW